MSHQRWWTDRVPYYSIDIETTGLDPERCQILEIGIVIDNWVDPLDTLPRLEVPIRHEQVYLQAGAYHLNADLLGARFRTGFSLMMVMDRIRHFIKSYEVPSRNNVAGKNFGGFDLQFIRKLPDYRGEFGHRSYDPSMYFWRPGIDHEVPSTQKCLERAGLPSTVTHRALDDALDIVRLMRAANERCGSNPAVRTKDGRSGEASA